MSWLRRLIHKLMGRDRYHDQANEVNNRRLRVELLSKELELYRRGKPR
jgi:hypothetical protein